MINTFDAFIDLFQGILMIWFLRSMLPKQQANHAIAVTFGLLTGFLLILWESLNIDLPDTLIFLLPFIYTLLFLHGSFPAKAIWLLIIILVFGVSAQITTGVFLFFTDIEGLFQPGLFHIAYCVAANLITVSVFVMIIHIFSHEKTVLLGKRNVFLFSLCYALEAGAEEVLYYYQLDSGNSNVYILCLNIYLAGLVFLTMILQNTLAKTIRKKQITEAQCQILKETDRHQKEIETIYRDVLANQHTLRHQIDIIRNTVHYSSDPNAAKLLNQLEQKANGPQRFMTGSTAVDALLTAKYLTAQQHGIHFDFQLCPLKEVSEMTDFCVILSNILDNALEAVERIEDPAIQRKISLEISRSWDMLYLRCINTMNSSTLKYERNYFSSSKEPQKLHGYGISTIRDLTEQLQGNCEVIPYPEQALFVVQISLPIDK